MVARKKPEGEEWFQFVTTWQAVDHAGKVELCKRYSVSYDTGKHWVSEQDTTPAKTIGAALKETATAIGEVLMLQPKVELDFVGFDIETTNLTADFSIILSACVKPFGKKTLVFRGDNYPDWVANRANDSVIVNDIAREVSRHAVVVTHYGSRFDIPYLRAKMVKYGIPPLPPMFGVDTYSIAKANFKVSRRRLAALAEYFQLGKKEGVEGNLWVEAAMTGSKEAMDKIVAHNMVDVEILEKLAAISFPYLRSIRRL